MPIDFKDINAQSAIALAIGLEYMLAEFSALTGMKEREARRYFLMRSVYEQNLTLKEMFDKIKEELYAGVEKHKEDRYK